MLCCFYRVWSLLIKEKGNLDIPGRTGTDGPGSSIYVGSLEFGSSGSRGSTPQKRGSNSENGGSSVSGCLNSDFPSGSESSKMDFSGDTTVIKFSTSCLDTKRGCNVTLRHLLQTAGAQQPWRNNLQFQLLQHPSLYGYCKIM